MHKQRNGKNNEDSEPLIFRCLYILLVTFLIGYVTYSETLQYKSYKQLRVVRSNTVIYTGSDQPAEFGEFKHDDSGEDASSRVPASSMKLVDYLILADDIGVTREEVYASGAVNDDEINELDGVQVVEDEGSEGDDVQAFKRKKKKKKEGNRKPTISKFKMKEIGLLQERIVKARANRINSIVQVTDQMEDDPVFAKPAPFYDLTEADKLSLHIPLNATDYPDYSSDKVWNPTITKILNSVNYDPYEFLAEGQTQFIVLFPATLPMGSLPDKHVEDYQYYYNFIHSFKPFMNHFGQGRAPIRISFGLYHRGISFQPANSPYKEKFPWKRAAGTYLTPKASFEQPRITQTLRALRQVVGKFGGQDRVMGRDCFTLWFHHDIFADLSILNFEDEAEKISSLNEMCTIIHIFVGFKEHKTEIERYAILLNPRLRDYRPLDPKISGVRFIDDHSGLNDDLRDSILKYMAIVRNRQGCRCTVPGYTPKEEKPATEYIYETEEDKAYAADFTMDYGAYGLDNDDGLGNVVPGDEILEKYVTNINGCCGADLYDGVPFDSVEKSCCDDGTIKTWSDPDVDPCIDFKMNIRK